MLDPGLPPTGEPPTGWLVDQLVGPVTPAAPMGTYVLSSDRPEAELAVGLERAVFGEAFGNSPELLAEEYGPYEGSSVFLCVVDHRRRRPAGMMRLIVPSAAGLKSLNDVEPTWEVGYPALFGRLGVAYRPEATWDIATLAVAPEYQRAALRGLATSGLCQALSVIGARCGVEHFVAILHLPVFRMLQARLRAPFVAFPRVEARAYLDSPASLPVLCDLPAWQRRLAGEDETLHELMCEGKGLEPAVRPCDWDAAAECFAEVTRRNAPGLRLLAGAGTPSRSAG